MRFAICFLTFAFAATAAAGCRRAPRKATPPAGEAAPVPVAVAASIPSLPPPPQTPTLAASNVDVPCPAEMVPIPATGDEGFQMGRADRGETDKPHRVVLTHPYCLDETEVTVLAYSKCVEAAKCGLPYLEDQFATYPRFPDKPVNMVNWEKARSYCEWAGKRLPTEAEWEWAATGPEGSKYPWGDAPEPTCGVELADFTPFGAPKSNPGGNVGCFGGGPSPVRAHPKGVKRWPGGALYDLAGNVWEWTEDSYAPYTTDATVDPLVRKETANHAIRGGGWNRPARALQGSFRGSAIYSYQVPGLGFRCASGAPHPTPPPRQKRGAPEASGG